MKREVKIGIFAVAMIAVAWGGIRFLSGLDVLGSNTVYYGAYDQINGVQNASPILMKGVKIGTVTGMSFDPDQSDKVILHFTISKKYRIPSDSEARIISNGLMGGKAIDIHYGSSDQYLNSGDTLRASRDRDLMDVAGSELEYFKQQFAQISGELTRTLENINGLLERNADHIDGTLGHLDTLSGDLASVMSAERENLKTALNNITEFSRMLGENTPRIDSMINNINRFSTELANEKLVEKLGKSVEELSTLLDKVNHGDGSMARLMNDPALYESVNQAVENLSALLADLKAYPARYVHLSVFGKDPEKMKERAERKAARKAEKAEKAAQKAAQKAARE